MRSRRRSTTFTTDRIDAIRSRQVIAILLTRMAANSPSDAAETDARPFDTRPGGFATATLDSADATNRSGSSYHAGVPYQDLGMTRAEFEDAADRLSHLKGIWDHDELDIYNDLLEG